MTILDQRTISARTKASNSAGVPVCTTMPSLTTLDLKDSLLAALRVAAFSLSITAAGVPAGPVHTIGEALSHPQTLARGMVVETRHPAAGATKAIGCPVHFSETPTAVTRPAPVLGEHTREVLAEAGYSAPEIDALLSARAVQ